MIVDCTIYNLFFKKTDNVRQGMSKRLILIEKLRNTNKTLFYKKENGVLKPYKMNLNVNFFI